MVKRKKDTIKYIYGPVFSWRLGCSLGIDLISAPRKVCTLNCIYCQLGSKIPVAKKRQTFSPTKKVINEFKTLFPLFSREKKIDYITFSGMGEPTLAKNLGAVIRTIKSSTKIPIAILTNSALIDNQEVRRQLKKADSVVLKLDVPNEEMFKEINRPHPKIKFKKVLNGLKKFRKEYKGKFALQIMLVKANKIYAKEIARLAREIKPDEVQINTPLRACAVKPLSKKEIAKIKKHFRNMNVVGVYDVIRRRPRTEDKATLKRRTPLKN